MKSMKSSSRNTILRNVSWRLTNTITHHQIWPSSQFYPTLSLMEYAGSETFSFIPLRYEESDSRFRKINGNFVFFFHEESVPMVDGR